MSSFQLFTLLTLIHSINAIVEAATTIVNVVFTAIIILIDGCQLASADVALFLSLASHLEHENNEKSEEICRSHRINTRRQPYKNSELKGRVFCQMPSADSSFQEVSICTGESIRRRKKSTPRNQLLGGFSLEGNVFGSKNWTGVSHPDLHQDIE